jgi:hypothetical protein
VDARDKPEHDEKPVGEETPFPTRIGVRIRMRSCGADKGGGLGHYNVSSPPSI